MSDLFDRIDSYVEERFDLDPIAATELGAPGRDHRMTDLSPAGSAALIELDRRFFDELASVTVDSEAERVALAFMRERLEANISMFEGGEHLRGLGAIWSRAGSVRDIFALMPLNNDTDWHTVGQRLAEVPVALRQERESLEAGIAQGLTAAQRQAKAVARFCLVTAGEEAEGQNAASQWFVDFVSAYDGTDAELRQQLNAGAAGAGAAFAEFGHWLLSDYVPQATAVDAVGPDRYARMARVFTGASLDLAETYEWGWQELARLHERVDRVVEQIVPGGTLADAIAALDVDPVYVIDGEPALLEFLQGVIDSSIAELNGTYFDIPEPMQVCEACIAPPGGAAAQYYTAPSEDFSRPGRTWWPTQGKNRFHVWSALSTWFHEGVPGHHQQVAYTMLQRDRLSRAQRTMFISGHGEGWALYAERLMDELGKFTSPGYELGFLQGQCLRASRVVVDIGLHLQLPLAASPMSVLRSGDHAGEVWHRDLAVEFLVDRGLLEPDFAASEADRYLGLPGQAISYKIGERAWLEARANAMQRKGADFNLREWHTKSLALGPLGLDPLVALASEL